MPMFDLSCEDGHEWIDAYLKIGERPPCPTCGKPTSTLWRSSSNVVGDDIPGGYVVRHGLVGPNGEPMKFYSKSAIAAEAKRRGLVNYVEHTTDPRSGSDKSKFTKRWI